MYSLKVTTSYHDFHCQKFQVKQKNMSLDNENR